MDLLSYQLPAYKYYDFEIRIHFECKHNKVLVDTYKKLVLNKKVKVQILQDFCCFFYLQQINIRLWWKLLRLVQI